LAGHTTRLGESFTKDGDFYQTVYSEQNANDQSGPRAGAAHDDTFLGLLRFEGGAAEAAAIADAITVDGMRTFVIKGLGKDIFEDDPTANQVGDAITDEEMFDFVLVNSETDEVVQALSDGAEINLKGLDLDQFSVRARVNPDHFYAGEVESVKFESNVGSRIENVDPYTLFSNQKEDYRGQAPEVGDVSITATAYSQNGGKGQEIGSSSLDYAFVESESAAIDALTGLSSTDPLTGDLAQPDSLTNVVSATDELAMGRELATDNLLDAIDIAPAKSTIAESAIVGTGDADTESAELDPFGDALPVGTQPTLIEDPYTMR
ncbi:MAG: hypothetical protein AAGD09_26260, partial [Cyanobacteria bacterium P01_F01_bin.56]